MSNFVTNTVSGTTFITSMNIETIDNVVITPIYPTEGYSELLTEGANISVLKDHAALHGYVFREIKMVF